MSEDGKNALIDLGDVSKPATALIEKVSSAVGGLFKPYQIKRVARAEAEAAMITAKSEIEVTELHRRAMHRFVEEEALRQQNMEQITQKAIPKLSEDSTPERLDDDWIANFFDKSRLVSDEEMQELWASVLSTESNRPGSYARRTVNLISDLDKSDAQLFAALCAFGWSVGNVVPLVFDVQASIYNQRGINFSTLSHLESLGLVQFNNIAGFSRLELPKAFPVHYYGRPLPLEMQADKGNTLDLGKVLLTKAGQELAPICGSAPVEGFYEYVANQWKAHVAETKP